MNLQEITMRRKGRFWKPKLPAHIRGWGAGQKHSEPLAKRDPNRRKVRHFAIEMKRKELLEEDQ
jgi:hypothetical protein